MDDDRKDPLLRFPIVMTDRLVLREITAEDAAFWLRNFSAPEVVELTAWEAPRDLEAAKAEIERFCTLPLREGTGIRWGITLRGSHDLVGTLGYHGWVQGRDRRARMGYDLLAEHRGKGIMTEAMGVALAYGFKTMTLDRVEVLIDPRNAPSLALVGRLGFHLDAHLRQSTRFRAGYQDDLVFSLLTREWRAAEDARP